MEYEGDGDANCSWCTWNGSQRLGEKTGGLGSKMTSGDHPDHRLTGIQRRVLETCGGLRSPLVEKCCEPCESYLPTPPLGQDMTQGQFLSGV